VTTFRRYLLLFKKAVFFYACAVVSRLSTEFAVLGTSSAPAVDDAAKVSVIAAEISAQHIRTLAKFVKSARYKRIKVVISAEPTTIYYFICKPDQITHTAIASLRLSIGKSRFPSTADNMQSTMSPGTASKKQYKNSVHSPIGSPSQKRHIAQ
jgi:hypothetical protein